MSTTRPTYAEIANDYALWTEHFDTDGNMTEAEFDALSEADAIRLLTEAFGPEVEADELTGYRAAYWVSDDCQASVCLTTEAQAHLSDEDLMKDALSEAEANGLDLSGGSVLIGTWKD